MLRSFVLHQAVDLCDDATTKLTNRQNLSSCSDAFEKGLVLITAGIPTDEYASGQHLIEQAVDERRSNALPFSCRERATARL